MQDARRFATFPLEKHFYGVISYVRGMKINSPVRGGKLTSQTNGDRTLRAARGLTQRDTRHSQEIRSQLTPAKLSVT